MFILRIEDTHLSEDGRECSQETRTLNFIAISDVNGAAVVCHDEYVNSMLLELRHLWRLRFTFPQSIWLEVIQLRLHFIN
jgi:hypothetical protein